MEISKEVMDIISWAVGYAKVNAHEFITPETILLGHCTDKTFCEVFETCGGDVEVLKKALSDYLAQYATGDTSNDPEFSVSAKKMLAFAELHLSASGKEILEMKHVLRAIWQLKESYAVFFMRDQGVDEVDMLRELAEIEDDRESGYLQDDDDWDMDGEEDEGDDGEEEPDIEFVFASEAEPDSESGPPDLIEQMKRLKKRRDAGEEDYPEGDNPSAKRNYKASKLKDMIPCLNDTLPDEVFLIGREAELERTIQVLCRKEKNNPLHIGEPGVGKTAITYGLVDRIRHDDVPEPLLGARVYALNIGGLLAGTQYRGQFEEKFKKMMDAVARDERPIIYVDEIHNLVRAGAVEGGSLDLANMLKPYLADGHIRFIGATTFDEYKKHFEKDRSMVRRFQNIEVKEPTVPETVEILEGLVLSYEEFHHVTYEEGILEYIAGMSAKFVNDRFLPDKAIDILDESGAYRRLHPEKKHSEEKHSEEEHSEKKHSEEGRSEEKHSEKKKADGTAGTVDKDVVNAVLTSICRVPVESVESEDDEGLSTLEERIRGNVFGQDEAVKQVVNAIKFSRAGLLEEGKPLASLLFVGPTGVGKTEIAKCLAKELGVKLVRFDMSEYSTESTVSKLIGASAGLVGYEEGGLLTEEIRKNPSSVLLLDEIEKANDRIYNILLQVMDYATLTDNQGRKADFRNVVIIMTSNAGAEMLGKMSIGFRQVSLNDTAIADAVKQTFRPEFRNRLNKVVVFREMDEEMADLVVGKKLRELSEMLKKRGITFTADKAAKELLKKKGVSREFGAREIDRVIRNEVKSLLVDDILFGKLKNGGKLRLTAKGEEFLVKC